MRIGGRVLMADEFGMDPPNQEIICNAFDGTTVEEPAAEPKARAICRN